MMQWALPPMTDNSLEAPAARSLELGLAVVSWETDVP
jgi:hypothetical protein